MRQVGIAIALAAVVMLAIGEKPMAQEQAEAETFAQKAAVSNSFEIEAAQLALQKSVNDKTKAFATDMSKDHGKAAQDMAEAAKEEGITLPTELDGAFQNKLEALKAAGSGDFDQAYLSTQVTAHDDAVSLFEQYVKNGPPGALRAFAEQTLPTLRMHQVRVHGMTSP